MEDKEADGNCACQLTADGSYTPSDTHRVQKALHGFTSFIKAQFITFRQTQTEFFSVIKSNQIS